MAADELSRWLRRQRRNGMVSSALYAVATLSGGLIVLALTFGLFFLLGKLLLLFFFPGGHSLTAWSLIFASIIMAVFFADSLRASRDDMSFIPLWLLREYFYIGPRVIREGFRETERVFRLARMNVSSCGEVLAHLARQSQPTLRTEIARNFPHISWDDIVEQLSLFPGVLFFRPDSARVSLTTPLRLKLRQILQIKGTIPPPQEPRTIPVSEPEKLSPSEILGVRSDASLREIKAAYRSRIKECHPDRFAEMDERSRALAEEWTKSLNGAYEALLEERISEKP